MFSYGTATVYAKYKQIILTVHSEIYLLISVTFYFPGIGTYEYNAPERLGPDKKNHSYPSDLWSLGITLHELASREHPIRFFKCSTLCAVKGSFCDSVWIWLNSIHPIEVEFNKLVKLRLLIVQKRKHCLLFFHGSYPWGQLVGAEIWIVRLVHRDWSIESTARYCAQNWLFEEMKVHQLTKYCKLYSCVQW